LDEERCDAINELVEKEHSSWAKGLNNISAKTTGWNGIRYPILEDLAVFTQQKILPHVGQKLHWDYYNRFTCREVWINYYQAGDDGRAHNHVYTDISVVLITKPGNGNLIFNSLQDIYSLARPFEKKRDFVVNDIKGQLIIFPGWLYHSVAKCVNERITVAMNFTNEFCKE
jgi:hypothetical protein